MNTSRTRELRHGYLKLAALLLPVFVIGCSARRTCARRRERRTRIGTLNFPGMRKRPTRRAHRHEHRRTSACATNYLHHRRRSLSAPTGPPRLRRANITASITMGPGDVRISTCRRQEAGVLIVANRTSPIPIPPSLPGRSGVRRGGQTGHPALQRQHHGGPHRCTLPPDGRIVFASDPASKTKAILIDEGRP